VNEPPFLPVFKRLRRLDRLTLALAAISALSLTAQLFGDSAVAWLRYDRQALEHGEIWRLLSGHLVHLGMAHVLLNISALLILRLIFQDFLDLTRWGLAAATSVIGIDLGLYLVAPQIEWYVGLSGVLHGICVAGALAMIQRRSSVGWALLLLVLVKVVYEQIFGPSIATAAAVGGDVIVEAHLFGAVGGLLAALIGLKVPYGQTGPV